MDVFKIERIKKKKSIKCLTISLAVFFTLQSVHARQI